MQVSHQRISWSTSFSSRNSESFFANIKQYRPELEPLMTLKFQMLERIGVFCFLRRNWATDVLYGGQDCARPAILIHFFKKE